MIESLIMTQFELRARLTQLNFSILISIYASCEMCLNYVINCTEVRFASFLSGGLNIINSRSSESRSVLWQKNSPIGGSFWQKDSLITHILFDLWLIMIFSPPERKLAKRTSVHCVKLCTIPLKQSSPS